MCYLDHRFICWSEWLEADYLFIVMAAENDALPRYVLVRLIYIIFRNRLCRRNDSSMLRRVRNCRRYYYYYYYYYYIKRKLCTLFILYC